jgi:competence protein ComEC
MFTGDATKYTESLIMDNESKKTLHSQVLKLGHHGSKHSSSESWLKEVKPDIAIISAVSILG